MALLDHRITSAHSFVWAGEWWADIVEAHAATADIEPDDRERMERLVTARYTQHLDLMIDLPAHSTGELELIAADAGYPVRHDDDDEDEDVQRNPVWYPLIRMRALVERRFGDMFDAEAATFGARSDEPAVRALAAQHPLLPVPEIEALLEDPDVSIRLVALGRVDGSVAARCADDEHRFVRRALARHPNAPPEVLAVLAADDDVGVRHGVALNERVSEAVLHRLTQDTAELVARAAARRFMQKRHDRAAHPHRDPFGAVFVLTIDPTVDPSLLQLRPNPFGPYSTDVCAEDLPFYGPLIALVEHVEQSPPGTVEAAQMHALTEAIREALAWFSPWWAVEPPGTL